MKREQEYLLKHFASVLRSLALGKEVKPVIDTNVAHCLTRRDLIQIVKKQFGGNIPKEHDLVEMEKLELLGLVENEMLIISHMTEKWSGESPVTSVKKEIVKLPSPIKKEPNKTPQNKKKDETVSK